jgi:hypothetical protein
MYTFETEIKRTENDLERLAQRTRRGGIVITAVFAGALLFALLVLIGIRIATAEPTGTHKLVWDPNAEDDEVVDYRVWLQVGDEWEVIATVPHPTTEYRRTGLANGEYTYRLTARNATGESGPSLPCTGSILGPPAPPGGCAVRE